MPCFGVLQSLVRKPDIRDVRRRRVAKGADLFKLQKRRDGEVSVAKAIPIVTETPGDGTPRRTYVAPAPCLQRADSTF